MWHTGGRCRDIVLFRKEDVRKDEITFRKTKGGKDRVVPIDEGLFNMLSLYAQPMRYNDRVFSYTISKDGDVPTLRKVLKQYLPDDMKWVHPHTFHHSYAVYVLKNGMNIRSLQKILGHDSLETTAVYLDLLSQDIKDEHKKIHW